MPCWELGAGAPSLPPGAGQGATSAPQKRKLPKCLPFFPWDADVTVSRLGVKRGGDGGHLPHHCWACPPCLACGLLDGLALIFFLCVAQSVNEG